MFKVKSALIRAAFAILEKFLIRKIDFAPLRQFFEATIGKAQNVAEILTDKDPQNTAQLAEFWRAHQHDLLQDSIPLAIAVVEAKVKEAWARDMIVSLLESLDEKGNIAE